MQRRTNSNMNIYNLFLVFMYHRFPSISCLDCFSCQNVGEPSLCNTSVTCGLNQYCFLDDLGGSYSMGCMDSRNCRTHAASLVGRNVGDLWTKKVSHGYDVVLPLNRRQTSKCHECCSSDGCNKDLCQHLKPSQCSDDESLDCAKLATIFNICQDIHKAKSTCPRFCDLCNLVDGQWAQWTSWSGCDVTCSTGSEIRKRTCTNPAPANGGLDCAGNNTENKVCHKQPCPVHGGWSDWSSWGSCSATCDVGLERRDRSCSNPSPSLAGDHCFGDAHEDRICFSTPCADGGWSDWNSWGTCSKTCDTGTRSRSRTCTHPRPSFTGRYCDGVPVEVDTCKTQICSDTKVAFNARKASYSNPPKFTTVFSNYGDGYNSSTGKFTSPVAGIYFFASTITKQFNVPTNLTACHMYVNSVDMLGTHEAPYNSNDDKDGYSLTLLGTFHLNKNDVVQIMCPRGFHAFYDTWCSFTGFLITSD